MLSDASREIQVASAHDEDERRRKLASRDLKRRIDSWMEAVENLLEHDSNRMPEPLLRDITAFMRAFDARLHRTLVRDRTPLHVLDVLFEAQEELQLGTVAGRGPKT